MTREAKKTAKSPKQTMTKYDRKKRIAFISSYFSFFSDALKHTHKSGDMNKIQFFFLECISHDGAIEIKTMSSICGAHSATSIERYSPL